MTVNRAIRRAIITIALLMGATFSSAAPAMASSTSVLKAAKTSSTAVLRAAARLLGRPHLTGTGYWVVDRGGGVASGGGAPLWGSLSPFAHPGGPIVAMAPTPDGGGYWLASATGGVYSFGNARFYGALGPGHLARTMGQIVGMAATRDGRGYWLASATGGVYSFGDARFYGPRRTGTAGLVVAIAATPGGGGYWLMSSAGRVLCFGDATYHGSAAAPGQMIVGFAPSPDGRGYWMATARGGVISFGDARARGSELRPGSPSSFIGIAAEHNGKGYWFVNSSGTTFGFGPAATAVAHGLAHGAVAIVADPAVVIPGRPVLAAPGALVKQSQASSDLVGEIAAQFALSQLGKPYIWGATGPFGYDCSGLALASWKAAGVDLPRTAAAQYFAGAHIPLSDVQPGDLIFWALDPSDPHTIYHVAISLGGERSVQAAQTGQNVQVLDLWRYGLVPLATRP